MKKKKISAGLIFLAIVFFPIWFFYYVIKTIVKLSKPKPPKNNVFPQKKSVDDEWDEGEEVCDDDENEPNNDELSFKVSGVTYLNEDGTSRQEFIKNLKHARRADRKVELRQTTWENRIAFNVFINGFHVGIVPKEHIENVSKFLPDVKSYYVRSYGGNLLRNGEISHYGLNITMRRKPPWINVNAQ